MSIDLVAPSVRQSAAVSLYEQQRRIERAWKYYLGNAAPVLAVSEDGVDDNVPLNFAKTIVVKGVSWLFGNDRALAFGIEDDDAAQTKFDDEIWPLEDRAITLHKLGVNGGVAGHTFCKLTAEGRAVVWDPSNVEVVWDDEDIEKVLEYRYSWTALKENGEPYVRRQRITNEGTSWLIVDEKSDQSGAVWEVIDEETWAREWSPVHECQNLPMPNEFWGEADLETDVLDLIDAIAAVAGYSRKMIRHRGHPLPYVTGEEADRLKSLSLQIGRLLAVPNPQAKVGQLTAGDLGGALDLYGLLLEAFHFETRMPPIAFGLIQGSNIAEETVELAYSPAVEKTWDKRLTYGPMLTALAEHKMELANLARRRPRPQWTSPVPRSAQAEVQSLEADQRMGIVSRQTLAEARGYDWDVEEPRIAEEKKANAEAMAAAFDAGAVEGDEEEDEE